MWLTLQPGGNYSWTTYQTQQFFPPYKSNDKTIVSLPNEVYEEGVLQWRNFVIAQFVGKIPDFSVFQKLVNMLGGGW